MTVDAWLTALVLVGILIGLAKAIVAPSVLIFSGVAVLLVADVIDAEQAFSGFSNPAPITVGALFIVAAAVSKTGAIRPIVRALMGDSGDVRRPLLRVAGPTALVSGFLNNTPLVAMMIPEITTWARRRGAEVSKFLLPLSYAAILGGLLTLIGTSTNLVVAGGMLDLGLEPFSFFELGKLGLPIAVVGLAAIVALSPRLLKGRRSSISAFQEETRQFTVEVEVIPDGGIDGMTVEEAGLRHLAGVFLAAVDRGDTTIAPASPDTVLRGGNLLRFVGQADLVVDIGEIKGIRFTEHHNLSELGSPAGFFQVVVAADSPFAGMTLKEARFRSQYQAAVVAVHRAGHRLEGKLGEVRLRTGDSLIVLADRAFGERWHNRHDFLTVVAMQAEPPTASAGRVTTVLILTAMVVSASAGWLPILDASLLAVIALLITRVLGPAEARRSIDLDVIGVIASAFGLAAAMDTSGLADVVAEGITSAFSSFGTTGTLLGVVLATVLLTELVTNNAAALLMLPIGLAVAEASAVDPRGMAAAVAVAASASFLTPIGYQTNTMVYGPGGYRVSDYLKMGAPLTLIVVVGVTALVPMIYPA